MPGNNYDNGYISLWHPREQWGKDEGKEETRRREGNLGKTSIPPTFKSP
jgi:hypothetical protein